MTQPGEIPRHGGERLDDPRPDQAVFALDLVDVLQEPAVAGVLAIDRGDGTMGQLNQYAQQMVLGYKAVQGFLGNTETIKNVDVMEKLDMGVVSHSLRAANDLYAMLGGAASALDYDRDEFTRSFPRLSMSEAPAIITGITNDMKVLCGRGLISPDGSSENYQELAKRLRLLNLVMLFSPQVNETDRLIDTYTNVLYNNLHQTPIANESRVRKMVELLGSEVTDGSRLATLTRGMSDRQRLNLYNRACEHLLLNNAAAQFAVLDDVQGTRRAYQRAFRSIADRGVASINDRVVEMVHRLEEPANEKEDTSGIVDAAKLDWEVLPEAELEERARRIVGEAGRAPGKKPEIALERLVILSKLRDLWGRDKSYYVYGKLGSRETVKAGEQEQPDHYILLILQEHGPDGQVTAEHVVAESPIAGPNALYVFRQDVSDGRPWQKVMALPKKYARALKARQVKHTMPRGQNDLIGVMIDKINILLRCETEAFSNLEFGGYSGGQIRVRIGRTALTGEEETDED